MDLLLKLICVFGCGSLNSWGGYSWHNARRFLMPILLGGEAGLLAWESKKKDWWSGFLILPVIGTLCLGYFSGKNWGRALWLFVQAVVIGLGLFLTHHLHWYIYAPYSIGSGILGGFYKNWYQPFGDFVAGCYLGSVVFFIF